MRRSKFDSIYFKVIDESKAPMTFTPESLLKEAVKLCFWHSEDFGAYHLFTLDEIVSICKDDLPFKDKFARCLQSIEDKNDFAILLFYFKDRSMIEKILLSHGYIHPENKRLFSNKEAFSQIQRFFADGSKKAANFNSIDVDPSLGCIIGINGSMVSTWLEFEKELDHGLSHYFEGFGKKCGAIRDLSNDMLKRSDAARFLQQYYGAYDPVKIEDVRAHFFDDVEFRSMCANVYHDIIMHNYSLIGKKIDASTFIRLATTLDLDHCPEDLKDSVIFSWTTLQISKNRWSILRNGIEVACNEKTNIFQRLYRKTADWIRNLLK